MFAGRSPGRAPSGASTIGRPGACQARSAQATVRDLEVGRLGCSRPTRGAKAAAGGPARSAAGAQCSKAVAAAARERTSGIEEKLIALTDHMAETGFGLTLSSQGIGRVTLYIVIITVVLSC